MKDVTEKTEVEKPSEPNEEKHEDVDSSLFDLLLEREEQLETEKFKNSLIASKKDLTLFRKELFQAAVSDKNTAEAIIALILQRAHVTAGLTKLIVLTEVEVSEYKHGVRYDLLIKDEEDNLYDLEVQNETKEDLIERSLVYLARMIISQLDKGVKYKNLKNSTIIFFAKQDILETGKPIHHLRLQDPLDESVFIDKAHLIFVNGSYPYDGTLLSDLIHDFKEPDPEKFKIPVLKERVKYLKSQKGEKTMDATFESFAKSYVQENEEEIKSRVMSYLNDHKDKVRDEVKEEVRKEVKEEVRKEVKEEVRKEVKEEVRKEVEEEVRKEVEEEVSLKKKIAVAISLFEKTDMDANKIAIYTELPFDTVLEIEKGLLKS